ncbi:type II secretion system protein [Sulfurovum sp.]|uniref:type II secretion system protein n=1 Tax=Sulfurovum sp. TaxID=1969726 RepID=UPI0035671E03
MVKFASILTPIRVYSRKAFTMIELIFAIVVIAVVMLTIPMMIQVNNKALEGNVAQEAIFLVSAVLSGTTTLLWDDASLEGDVTGVSLSKILDTGGDAVYNREVNSTLRKGGLDEDLHRNFFSNTTPPDQTETITLTDVLDTTSASEAAGYKNIYSVDVIRGYISDTPGTFVFSDSTLGTGVTSNVKMTQVEVNATIDGTNLTIARLRAYTCNIGEIDYAKRRME